MASPNFNHQLRVEIYQDEDSVLGAGSYGKVYKAKYGQLPCAAKLLRDMFEGSKLAEDFECECQLLSAFKHPNIVQYLGTSVDPQSQRLALLMELMDGSLTKFLERSTDPLPYHTQLNICHDVALALSYLHSNAISHRDLSSNNVLLIGEGSRAKVTDFGVSKLMDMNPRMTPLTLCPGSTVYMPPEALITPPQYSNKLDCFSHGVLTIQIITRNFPAPGDAHRAMDDPNYPSAYIVQLLPETERRKEDIDLIESDHPLLPIALDSLHNKDAERPSADELCSRLAALKGGERYTSSVEQSRDHATLVQRLQEEMRLIQKEREEFCRERSEFQNKRMQHQNELVEKDELLKKVRETYQDELALKDQHIKQMKADHEVQLAEKDNLLRERAELIMQERDDHRKELAMKDQLFQDKDLLLRDRVELIIRERGKHIKEMEAKDQDLQKEKADPNPKSDQLQCHQNELEKGRTEHLLNTQKHKNLEEDNFQSYRSAGQEKKQVVKQKTSPSNRPADDKKSLRSASVSHQRKPALEEHPKRTEELPKLVMTSPESFQEEKYLEVPTTSDIQGEIRDDPEMESSDEYQLFEVDNRKTLGGSAREFRKLATQLRRKLDEEAAAKKQDENLKKKPATRKILVSWLRG